MSPKKAGHNASLSFEFPFSNLVPFSSFCRLVMSDGLSVTALFSTVVINITGVKGSKAAPNSVLEEGFVHAVVDNSCLSLQHKHTQKQAGFLVRLKNCSRLKV